MARQIVVTRTVRNSQPSRSVGSPISPLPTSRRPERFLQGTRKPRGRPLENFARYELYACTGDDPCSRTGDRLSIGEKITFCIADVFRRNATDDSPASAYYGLGCGRQSTQGLSVGWGDQYTKSLSGQELSVDGLSPGVYCFVSTADPSNQLVERDDADNSESIRLTLGDGDDVDTALDTVTKGLAGR